jgi:hypothetical protein
MSEDCAKIRVNNFLFAASNGQLFLLPYAYNPAMTSNPKNMYTARNASASSRPVGVWSALRRGYVMFLISVVDDLVNGGRVGLMYTDIMYCLLSFICASPST